MDKQSARGRRQPRAQDPARRSEAPCPPQQSQGRGASRGPAHRGRGGGAPRPGRATPAGPPSARPSRGDSASGDPLRAPGPAQRPEPPAAHSGGGAAPPSPPVARRPLTPRSRGSPTAPSRACPSRLAQRRGLRGPGHRAGAWPIAAALPVRTPFSHSAAVARPPPPGFIASGRGVTSRIRPRPPDSQSRSRAP